MTDPSSGAIIRHPRWPWVVLGLGLVWSVLIRVPLILNAEDHLDSDLAVDGLTLIDAVNGHWRWHYPGTPHMGILPMLFSYPQALIWGANAVTLVSGGTLIWLLIVIGTFWLAWKAFGPSVAGWAILPLVCSSNGTIWLSGRITGGHLLTLAWHILAFVGLHACISKGGKLRAATFGLWCGLGLYLDLMFLFTLFGLVPASLLAWFSGGRWRLELGTVAAFLVGAIAGILPHEIGRLVDPYDAYPSQFVATLEEPAIREHGRLLAFHCLPRLVAGTELNDFDRSARRGDSILGKLLGVAFDARAPAELPKRQEWLAVLFLIGFFAGTLRLALDPMWARDSRRKAMSLGTFLSALLIVAAFLVNRNIFNSDNYRYLIYLLAPSTLGFGLLMTDLTKRGLFGRISGGILVVSLVWVMTSAMIGWYRDKVRYLDVNWRVMSAPRPPWSRPGLWRMDGDVLASGSNVPRRSSPYEVPSDVTHVFGGYWDVYRMSFLSGKKVVGIPYPNYPNRFPGWSHGLGPETGKLLVLGLRSDKARERSRRSQSGVVGFVELYDPMSRINWRSPFGIVWRNDGRDPVELDQIPVIVPSPDQLGL